MNQRVSGLIHLPGRGPVDLDASSVCLLGDPVNRLARPWLAAAEVSLRSAVGVELDEDIVADSGSEIEPSAYPRGCRHVVPGNFSGFQARHQPFAEAQPSGPVIISRSPCLPPPTVASIPRSRTSDDCQDCSCTSRSGSRLAPGSRRERGHSEVGITSEIAQQGDFAVKAARPAIRT